VPEDLSEASADNAEIDAALAVQFKLLSAEEKEMLSQALFPRTQTDKVQVCGKERTLRPLTIKWSKQVHILLAPFINDVQASGLRAGETDLKKLQDHIDQTELDLLKILTDVSLILAEFYGWEDVTEKIGEEDVYQAELQALVVRQMDLQKANDFLLLGLRVLVGVMQQAEIQAVRLLSMFSGQF